MSILFTGWRQLRWLKLILIVLEHGPSGIMLKLAEGPFSPSPTSPSYRRRPYQTMCRSLASGEMYVWSGGHDTDSMLQVDQVNLQSLQACPSLDLHSQHTLLIVLVAMSEDPSRARMASVVRVMSSERTICSSHSSSPAVNCDAYSAATALAISTPAVVIMHNPHM
jgi:hypothetical protein